MLSRSIAARKSALSDRAAMPVARDVTFVRGVGTIPKHGDAESCSGIGVPGAHVPRIRVGVFLPRLIQRPRFSGARTWN